MSPHFFFSRSFASCGVGTAPVRLPGVFARLCGWLVWLGLCVGVATAHAQAVAVSTASTASLPTLLPHGAEPGTALLEPSGAADGRWVLGLTASSSPAYAGAAQRKLGIRPVLAGRVGRWMVSTSSARRLAGTTLAGGISTSVASTDRWSVGLGLRLTHGRDSADSPLLQGLPDVRGSLAVRASGQYVLSPHWRLSGGMQQDVLHAQGLRASGGLGWDWPIGGGWVLDANTGLTWANAQAMRTDYGVPAAQATATRPAWNPGAGLEQWHVGVGVSRALTTHWRLSASMGRSTLLGQAASSPLTQQRSAVAAQIGLAYVGW